MRVITGTAKGRKLQMPPGGGTRAITDRAKSALFSIINDWIEGARVLDLFGGTGAVGIEFLSRGADFAQFIDLNGKAVATIWANLRRCQLAERAAVDQTDSFRFLERHRGEPYDFIFVAPPQYKDFWRKAMRLLDSRPDLLAEQGTVIVQIHPKEAAPLELVNLQEYDRRSYGSVMLIFYANRAELAEAGLGEGGAPEDASAEDDSNAPQGT